MDQSAIEKAAHQLRVAEAARQTSAPVRDILGSDSDQALAYAVQAANRSHWLGQGRRLIGRKVATSSAAAMKAFGISAPSYGMLYHDMVLNDGATIPVGRLCQPRLECEVAVVLEHDLDMPQPTLVDAWRAVGYLLPAIEVVDSRFTNNDAKIVDLIADNAHGAFFVLGATARKPTGIDLRRATGVLYRNGQEAARGTGMSVWGGPINALAWLAAKQAEIGLPLKAGDVVMTGTYCPMVPASPGDEIRVEIEGLGVCEVAFES